MIAISDMCTILLITAKENIDAMGKFMKKLSLVMIGDQIVKTRTLEGLRQIIVSTIKKNFSKTEDARVFVFQYYL